MGKEEAKTEVPEATENGTTTLSGKPAEAVAGVKEVKEDDSVKDMEEDKKAHEQAETDKMDEDSKIKEDNEMKEDEGTKEEKDSKEEEDTKEEKEKEECKTEAMEEENGPNEQEVAEEKVGDKEDEKEKFDEADDEVQKDVETKKEKGSTKRAKGKSDREKAREKKPKIVKEKKELEPRTPAVDRPVRERKSVERLVASIEKDSSRELHIEKGSGTPLKDIPNVAFKLSRRKTDDTFRLLHSILFGRRGKAFQVKSNISRFSGFVWHENEEKQRSKVKEKFDKCNKEKLLEFCDVLDIPTSKTTRRKVR